MIPMVISLVCGFAAVDEQAFRNEAPKAWEKYAVRARRLQGAIAMTSRAVHNNNKLMSEERLEFKEGEAGALLMGQTIHEGGKLAPYAELRAENPHYYFQLSRKKAEDPWKLTGVHRNLWQPGSIDDPKVLIEAVRRLPYSFTAIFPMCTETVLDPAYVVDNVSLVDESLCKVKFRFTGPDHKGRRMTVRSGSLIFDAKRYWVIRHLEAVASRAGREVKYEISYEYVEASGRFPILKKTTTKRVDKEEYEQVHDYELEEKDVAEIDFRLTAFGFAEPKGAPPIGSGSRWYLWFIGIGALLIVAGYGFHRWRRAGASQALQPV